MDAVHSYQEMAARPGNPLRRLAALVLRQLPWLSAGSTPSVRQDVRPAFAETFRILALELCSRAEHERLRSILVMSAYPGDGRTLTVAHLGMALAEQGKKVILVESDARRPDLAQRFTFDPVPTGAGGSLGPARLTIMPTQTPGIEIALALPLGQQPGAAASETAVLDALESRADFVLLDSPPCRDFGDAFFLASLVDGVVFIVRNRQQDVDTLRQIRSRLERLGANVLGVLYNDKG